MRAIAAIPPYASRPNSWPNKIDVARYEKYFPDGGGRRGRRPVGIIPRWTGKAIAGNRAPLRVCFRCRWVPGDVDGTASHLPERTGFACCNRRTCASLRSCHSRRTIVRNNAVTRQRTPSNTHDAVHPGLMRRERHPRGDVAKTVPGWFL
jgi:hypothetical protein